MVHMDAPLMVLK